MDGVKKRCQALGSGCFVPFSLVLPAVLSLSICVVSWSRVVHKSIAKWQPSTMYLLLFFGLLTVVHSRPSSWEINLLHSNSTRYGDMVLTPRQLARYDGSVHPVRHVYRKENSVNRWANNVVPYTLSPQYTPSQLGILRRSLRSLEEYSCFRFVERTNERDFLFIVPLDGCYSYVGKIGGKQLMSLAVDCIADYIIWHEVMHALGFEHEHQRPDRDQWIHVEYRNVQPGQMVNFEKILPYEVDYPDLYDYKSIMHYDGFAFGKIESGRRLATMVPIKSGIELEDNMQLSRADIEKLNRLGKCRSNTTTVEKCVDHPTAHCDKRAAQCRMEQYRPIMDRLCPRTCGRCSHREPCTDLDERCSTFASNGFCGNEAYGDEPRLRCPKTCGYC